MLHVHRTPAFNHTSPSRISAKRFGQSLPFIAYNVTVTAPDFDGWMATLNNFITNPQLMPSWNELFEKGSDGKIKYEETAQGCILYLRSDAPVATLKLPFVSAIQQVPTAANN